MKIGLKSLPLLLGVMVTFLTWGGILFAEPEVLEEWRFDQPESIDGWNWYGISEWTAEEEGIATTLIKVDPYFSSPEFEIIPRIGQYIEIRMKSESRGLGELYFTSDNPYFTEEQKVTWSIVHDGKWRTYRIYPHWWNYPKITRIRIDFGDPTTEILDKSRVGIESVKIVDIEPPIDPESFPAVNPDWTFTDNEADGWTHDPNNEISVLVSDFFALPAEGNGWASVTIKNLGPDASLSFVGEKTMGAVSIPIEMDSGTEGNIYNIPLFERKEWSGTIYQLSINAGYSDSASIERLVLGDAPTGPARPIVKAFDQTEAINRAGSASPIALTIKNTGGEPAEDIRLHFAELPEGISICDSAGEKIESDGTISIESIPPMETSETIFYLTSDFPTKDSIPYSLLFGQTEIKQGDLTVEFTEPLGLPKADYVPEPRPVETIDPELEIGALYFPGWKWRSVSEWEENFPGWPDKTAWGRIKSYAPIRKPVLGWYDEGNPEVIDWQIKWASEAGISFFLVDWYWNQGKMILEHWIKAFQKARYRGHLKWAMMWANHNGPGSHSVEDQEAVTKYWLENYFNTPEYYRIDDKPVVMIWSPEGMDNDIRQIEREENDRELEKGEGVKILLDLSREMAMEAGYKGIYFIAMKWPEGSTKAEDIEWLKVAGFDATSLYRYMEPINPPTESWFDYDEIVAGSKDYWRARQETGILPFLPNLSTGWDDRPWYNRFQVIANRTPEKFRTNCEDLKEFLAESGIKRICVGPLTEWGEGSYAEPNKEFGFKMYEALRETFCKEPEGGWPLYYGPTDVGLGPYENPEDWSSEE